MFAHLTKEFSYNWKLPAPVIMGMLGHTFVGFVDNIMVGQLGSAELAAVSLGNSFFFVAMSLGIGFSTAITPLVAEADSENNFKKGKSAFKHGLFLCIALKSIVVWHDSIGKTAYVFDGATRRSGAFSDAIFKYYCHFVNPAYYFSRI